MVHRLEIAQSVSTGLSDDSWWRLRQPLLAGVLGDDLPLAQRVGAAAGAVHNAPGDPDVSFRFGLDLLLDGVEAMLARRNKAPRSPNLHV